MAIVIKPPAALVWPPSQRTVFLAGSIAMGAAPPWQAEIARALAPHDLTVLDPRRDEWDSSWRQDIAEPRFREQVEWELEAQERADLIAMYFAPSTQAPVTLLELGLFARKKGGLVVCCPDGFWRRGNVQVVCARYGVPTVETLDELVVAVLARARGAAAAPD
jgi:hypothetical protein